ncbi:PTS N-acetylgalactosamine transporter subunit IID [Streptococcus suis]|nr:PTS N-acetylgalactosamine transporter subunit IID [Streptococcus suis]
MESNNKKPFFTDKEIDQLAWRTLYLQASFNYERMQAGGYLFSQVPLLNKLYKDKPEKLKEALTDNLDFINTSPHFVGFLIALLLSMEEAGEDRGTIRSLKTALFPPLAGIGDAIFWFTILPVVAGITSSLAIAGNILGPILFFITFFIILASRLYTTRLGYNLGLKAVSTIKDQSEKIGRAASVLGVTVIGGLISSYVHINLLTEFKINEESTFNLQTDFFDKIFPNLLPLLFVFLLYYFLHKKKTNPVILIVATFIAVIVLSFFGIL